ncbi:hypothetical protein ACIHCX_35430 [Streptomyces sp. NPDC052043]|uniref:hypothetical protein n=1 Tax=Streptomyces sp. NPDC052043 TaxID=3365684 RepID=UPI0037D4645B
MNARETGNGDEAVVALDVGGTHIKAAVMAADGTALQRRLAFQTTPQIVPAALGYRAGSLGAGLLALDAHHARRGVPLSAQPLDAATRARRPVNAGTGQGGERV